MILLTGRALGESEQEVEPAADRWERPARVFFSVGEVVGTHRRENTVSDDGAARARSGPRNDPVLTPL